VELTDLSNTSPAEIGQNNAHETFVDKITHVNKEQSYDIKLFGNTNGPYEAKFAVYFDWNQNGSFNDAGEVYLIDNPLTDSNGKDDKFVSQSITIPASALLGNTRMRVKKIYNDNAADVGTLNDPCASARYSQAEEYTVNVGNLAVSDLQKKQVSYLSKSS